MSDDQDPVYNTEVTPAELEERKSKYLKTKDTVTRYLKELTQLLEEIEEEPLADKKRAEFMGKFDTLDRQLIHRLDLDSYDYYEGKLFLDKHQELKNKN